MVRSYMLGLVLVVIVPLLSITYGRSQGQARDALQEFGSFSRARRSLTVLRELENPGIPSAHGLTSLKRRRRQEEEVEDAVQGDSPKKKKKGKKSKGSKKGKGKSSDKDNKGDGKKGKNILNDLMSKHKGTGSGGKSTKKG